MYGLNHVQFKGFVCDNLKTFSDVIVLLLSHRNLVAQYSRQIFILLFQRLQSSKTTKYIKSNITHFYSIKDIVLMHD
jgi:hypothetical protein